MRSNSLRPLGPLASASGRVATVLAAAVFFVVAGDACAQGWNPADMLRRSDRNGDGKLEADEVDERFKGFLERAAGEAGVRSGFPFDVRQLSEAMERRRRERERDDDDDDDRGRDRDRDRDRDNQPSKPEPLVPGFGETTEMPAPLSFGDGAVFLTRQQAETQYGTRLVGMVDRMMEQYDRNKSGALEQSEWEGGRWSTPPETSDVNKDGILTQSELYLRLKDRFSGNDDDDDDNDGDRNREGNGENARPSAAAARPAGVLSNVPGIGTGDVQGSSPVSSRNDRDRDEDDEERDDRRERGPQPAAGVIVGGGPNGAAPGRIVGAVGPGRPGSPGQWNRGDRNRDDEEDEDSEEDESSNSEEDANRERYQRFADTMLRQYDRNKNGVLEKDEWSKMTGDPGAADYDKDGNLTKDEMARRLSERYGGSPGGSSASSASPRTSSLQTNRTGVSSKDAYAASRAYGEEGTQPGYRFLTPVERLPSGLPDWFLEKDKNADAQVGMYEYADEWSDEEAGKFMKLDRNSDGFLSASEVQSGDGDQAAAARPEGGSDENRDEEDED